MKRSGIWTYPLIISCVFCISVICCNKDQNSAVTVQDIDGNSYTVIRLGEQLWMAENLRTSRFKDGSGIPFVQDTPEWALLTTPGYCWFNNDENNRDEFGAMYNWYAVNTCKICPEGWQVPSDEEWTELEIYLQNNGYNYDGSIDMDNDRTTNNKIGKAMTSTSGWIFSENEGAIGNTDYPEYQNLTEFNLLAGGYRNSNGIFTYLNQSGNCWSATERNPASAWYRRFVHNSVKVIRDDHSKKDGFSVRCVKYRDPD